jgi:hypothetical protein
MAALSFSDKVALFKKEVADKIELPEEAMVVLVAALKVAKFDQVETKTITITAPASAPAPTTVPAVVVSGAKMQNGYNLFVKAKMAEMKDFKLTAAAWKALTEVDKKDWNDKAKAGNAASGATSKSKGAKGLSGWNFYVKENSKLVKAANPALTSQEVMKNMGAAWKALDDATKKTWTAKAKGTA